MIIQDSLHMSRKHCTCMQTSRLLADLAGQAFMSLRIWSQRGKSAICQELRSFCDMPYACWQPRVEQIGPSSERTCRCWPHRPLPHALTFCQCFGLASPALVEMPADIGSTLVEKAGKDLSHSFLKPSQVFFCCTFPVVRADCSEVFRFLIRNISRK